MKKEYPGIHEQAMLYALEELKAKRRSALLRRVGRLIPISFMAGWAVVIISAMFS